MTHRKKLKTGHLYRDERIEVSRSASGVISVFCHGPIEVWKSSPPFDVCVVFDVEPASAYTGKLALKKEATS